MIERSAALPQMLKINPSVSIGGRGRDDRIICRVASGANDKPVSEQCVCVWMEGGGVTAPSSALPSCKLLGGGGWGGRNRLQKQIREHCFTASLLR